MRETYKEAIRQVYLHEGGYTNHPSDPGGPTNWGITISDARAYWKPNATAADVRAMPIEVADEIYRKRYADVLRYDELPAGLDYAVLDFGINSGTSRSAKYLQRVLKVEPIDGKIGLVTLTAARDADAIETIRALYKARLKFLRGLSTWRTFRGGWQRRCDEGLKLALKLARKYPAKPEIEVPKPEVETVPDLPPTDTGGKAIPDEPEINPPTKSKTIWGGILGYLTGAVAMVSAVFEHLNNKYALMALGGAFVVGSFALWLIVKGRLDVGKVAAAFKEED